MEFVTNHINNVGKPELEKLHNLQLSGRELRILYGIIMNCPSHQYYPSDHAELDAFIMEFEQKLRQAIPKLLDNERGQ